MKSQRLERFETSCGNCIFATWENNKQIGCSANRLEHFENVILAKDDKIEFNVIEGICAFKRPPTWNEGVASISKASYELEPKFNLVIDSDSYSDEELEKIAENMERQTYKKYQIFVFQKSNSSNKNKLISKIVKNAPLYHIIMCENDLQIANLIKNKTYPFTVIINSDSFDLSEYSDKIFKLLYLDNKKYVMFELGKEVIFMNVLLHYIVAVGFDRVKEETVSQNLYYAE